MAWRRAGSRPRNAGTRSSRRDRRASRSRRKRPVSTSLVKSRLVAATTRTSTSTSSVRPTGPTSCSWITPRSFGWSSRGSSPSSSRKGVPPAARRKRPGCAVPFGSRPRRSPRTKAGQHGATPARTAIRGDECIPDLRVGVSCEHGTCTQETGAAVCSPRPGQCHARHGKPERLRPDELAPARHRGPPARRCEGTDICPR